MFEIKKLETAIPEIYLSQVSAHFHYEKKTKPVTLMFLGDIMLDRGVEYMVKKEGSGDFKWPFLKIADYLKEADILFGNLEGPISDKGYRVGSIYSFRADPEAINGLTYAGFDILSLANNHIFDYGIKAMEDTFSRLKEAGIDYAGGGFSEKEARSGATKEGSGLTIVYLAYTGVGAKSWRAWEDSPGIAWLDENIAEDIKAAKEKADFVVVSMHFGEEYQTIQNSSQEYFARLAIDSGADLIIGHHPHVVQPVERYKSGYIAYSLGNFIFDQGFSEETTNGLLLKVLVQDGKIKEVIPIEIKINELFQPEITTP